MIIELEQRTQEWHDWRAGKDLGDGGPRITATMATAIMGTSPWQSKQQLLDEIKGVVPPKKTNFAMQRGIDKEDQAREALERHTGIGFKPYCVQHDEYPEYGASLDGIGMEEDEMVIAEIKVPGKKTLDLALQGLVEPHYYDQMQWQMACAGALKAIFWAWNHETGEGIAVNIQRDEERISEMLGAAQEFRLICMGQVVEHGPSPIAEVIAEELANKLTQLEALEKEIDNLKACITADMEASNVTEWRHSGLEFEVTKPKSSVKTDWKGIAQELKAPAETVKRFTTVTPPAQNVVLKVKRIKEKEKTAKKPLLV